MKRALFVVALFIVANVASARITGAKWQTYDADRNVTSQSAVTLTWEAQTPAVQIWGRQDNGSWRPYSDWLEADVMGSTGTVVVGPLSDGWWSWCAVPQEYPEVRIDQFSFWVRLVMAAVKRWTVFR